MLVEEKYLIEYIRSRLPPGNAQTAQTYTATISTPTSTVALPDTPVSHITSVRVNGNELQKGYQYHLSLGNKLENATLSFVSPLQPGDNLIVEYYTGPSYIQRGYPHEKARMPRISVVLDSVNVQPEGLYAYHEAVTPNTISEYNFTVGVWNHYGKDSEFIEIDGTKYYGVSGIEKLLEKVIVAFTTRPLIYPFYMWKIGGISSLYRDEEYQIAEREVRLTLYTRKDFRVET